jgi:AcrR family transcriptional regulator
MLAAATELLAEGVSPTVEQAAARAGVSRTTAYRYFPNQRALLLATYPELDAASLLDGDAPDDPIARLDLVTRRMTRQLLDHEPELRAMLRLSLETPPPDRDALPLRTGRAIPWIEEALEPVPGLLPAGRRRLALAIRAAVGIEALVWLTDVGRLSRKEAVEVMRSSARAILHAALGKMSR